MESLLPRCVTALTALCSWGTRATKENKKKLAPSLDPPESEYRWVQVGRHAVLLAEDNSIEFWLHEKRVIDPCPEMPVPWQ